METLYLKETGIPAAAEKAATVLAAGGLVLYPTDTLYGLGVDATNASALTLLTNTKGTESGRQMSIILPDITTLLEYATLNTEARRLAEHFLPGALTLVVPATNKVPKDITLNGSIGIRIPNDAFARALAQTFGKPITATSANRSGYPTPGTVAQILEQFGESAHDIALVIDDGARAGGTPSTVVSCVTDQPTILREGVLSRDVLCI